MTDPRLLVDTGHIDGRPRPASITWDQNRNAYVVDAPGTRELGLIYRINLNADGEPTKPNNLGYATVLTGIPSQYQTVKHLYQAVDPNGAKLDDPVDDLLDAAALIVGAVHGRDPHPEHVVPRNVGGRPRVGPAINIRLGDDLLARVDARAEAEGRSRADVVRAMVAIGLDHAD